MGLIQNIRNSFNSILQGGYNTSQPYNGVAQIGSGKAAHNLSSIISPVQLQRLRQDVAMWREAVSEVELAWFPQRVKIQRMFIDTILNGHVLALVERRQDLTMLRDFGLYEVGAPEGAEENAEWSAYFREAQWFEAYQMYTLDAIFYGYSLIALGDCVDNAFPYISPVRRWNVSPDRLNVTRLTYSLQGVPFLEEPYTDWHIWVPTPNKNGSTNCGYGLLYSMGLYEILLRNLLGQNADFTELYAQPYRVGKTQLTNGPERDTFESALRDMGSAGYAIIDPNDTIEFLETALGGTGYKSYADFELRLQKVLAKIVLGHEDAMVSTPGKLGGTGKEDSPASVAMADRQAKDGKFVAHVTNSQLLPKLRNIGFNIPDNLVFRYKNDDEKQQIRERKDTANLLSAQVQQMIKNAGGQPDWEAFSEATGMKVAAAPVISPAPFGVPRPPVDAPKVSEKVQNRLNKLYAPKAKNKI